MVIFETVGNQVQSGPLHVTNLLLVRSGPRLAKITIFGRILSKIQVQGSTLRITHP